MTMNSRICSHCRKALYQPLQRYQLRTLLSSTTARRNSSSSESLTALLSQPTWSVRSLLSEPSSTSLADTEAEITPQTLHHLLRLSALPPPSSPSEEALMLSTLTSQLHFVRAVRSVDTAGIEPLRAIRDETSLGQREQTIGLEQLKDALANEDVVGHARRPRRRQQRQGSGNVTNPEAEEWDVLAGAGETAGRYFVVRTGSTAAPAHIDAGQEEKTKNAQ